MHVDWWLTIVYPLGKPSRPRGEAAGLGRGALIPPEGGMTSAATLPDDWRNMFFQEFGFRVHGRVNVKFRPTFADEKSKARETTGW